MESSLGLTPTSMMMMTKKKTTQNAYTPASSHTSKCDESDSHIEEDVYFTDLNGNQKELELDEEEEEEEDGTDASLIHDKDDFIGGVRQHQYHPQYQEPSINCYQIIPDTIDLGSKKKASKIKKFSSSLSSSIAPLAKSKSSSSSTSMSSKSKLKKLKFSLSSSSSSTASVSSLNTSINSNSANHKPGKTIKYKQEANKILTNIDSIMGDLNDNKLISSIILNRLYNVLKMVTEIQSSNKNLNSNQFEIAAKNLMDWLKVNNFDFNDNELFENSSLLEKNEEKSDLKLETIQKSKILLRNSIINSPSTSSSSMCSTTTNSPQYSLKSSPVLCFSKMKKMGASSDETESSNVPIEYTSFGQFKKNVSKINEALEDEYDGDNDEDSSPVIKDKLAASNRIDADTKLNVKENVDLINELKSKCVKYERKIQNLSNEVLKLKKKIDLKFTKEFKLMARSEYDALKFQLNTFREDYRLEHNEKVHLRMFYQDKLRDLESENADLVSKLSKLNSSNVSVYESFQSSFSNTFG